MFITELHSQTATKVRLSGNVFGVSRVMDVTTGGGNVVSV